MNINKSQAYLFYKVSSPKVINNDKFLKQLIRLSVVPVVILYCSLFTEHTNVLGEVRSKRQEHFETKYWNKSPRPYKGITDNYSQLYCEELFVDGILTKNEKLHMPFLIGH
jgi:hypothetical protein